MQFRYVALAFLLIISYAGAQWTPNPFCPYPSDHVTRYPYPGNCSIYWECYNGAKYVMPCPAGLEFNAPLQQCDSPEIAKCDPYASTTHNPNPPTYTPPTRGPTIKPEPGCPYPSDNETFLPYPGDCGKYWECFQGHKYLYNCPPGLWWHEAISQCDYPGDFCDPNDNSTQVPPASTAPPSGSTLPNGNDPRCSPTGTEYYPEPGSCHQYVECLNGKSLLVDCPTGRFFSDKSKHCVEKSQSECCLSNKC